MQCPQCHAENREGRRFCGECGLSLASTCASCGFLNEGSEKFCGGCGKSLTPAPTLAEPKFGSPQSYTPKHLAEKILTSKAALEGERKQVTVLFADLKGSMELLADRDPEEARKLLDPVLERMMEAVHRYEGTVNQVMGDGIMALFGAPVAHEDHAVRACYAALRMQETVKRYAENARHAHGVNVQIRVGLNSGEVVVRAIGSDLHMDYTAVGQTTHLAARMEQIADPGTIVITPDTLALAEGYVEVKSLGPIPVKGLSEPIESFELIRGGQARTRLQAAALRGLTRFVGRDAEVEHLRRVLGQAGAGRGQLVALVGEAGVGKSRLTYEFTHSHRVQDWLILEASSVSYGKATSYLPVIDLLKGYFKIRDRDDHREMHAKVLGRVLSLDRALEPLLPPLLALLDVPVEDTAWQDLDPPRRRQRTLDAVKRLLLRESHVQPLLVVFEDLHWLDAETQALLDVLVESLPTARLLLLVNYRPEYQHGWGGKTCYSQLRLDALPPESADELLGALLGGAPALEPLKRLLVKRGNPFFIEESIRALVETGALAGERGAYRLTRPIHAIEVPATVQVILATRIDRLPAEDKQLLQTASVIGKDVPVVLLHAVAELTEDAVQRGLARLQAAEFLYETRLFPDPEYTFKHALTHEVAYGSLIQVRRRALHARIVEAMEALYRDRLAEQIERLGHHAFRGEMWDKAATYFRQAGAKAAARSANREAVAGFEQALAALQHLPERRETLEQGIDVRVDLRNSLLPFGEHELALGHLREAEPLAERLDDRQRLGRVLASMANLLAVTGDPERALAAGERAVALAEAHGGALLRARAHGTLGRIHLFLGNYRQAVGYLTHAAEVLEGDLIWTRAGGASLDYVDSRTWLAEALAQLGEFPAGITHGTEGLRIAEASGHPFSMILIYGGLAWLHLYQGTLRQAIPVLERGLAVCRASDLPFRSLRFTAALGYAFAVSGRFTDALPLLTQAIAQVASERPRIRYADWLIWLAEGCLLAERIDEASREAAHALALARRSKQRGNEAWAVRLLGEIAARRDPPEFEKADAFYREALALAAELCMRPLVAHCHQGLGKLYRRTGKREQAREHLTTAAAMYREMDMPSWLEQAEADQDT